MERKRNWHRWRLAGRRERARREGRFDGFEQSGSNYLTPPVTPDINGLMPLTTEALKSRLGGVGLRDPQILDKSNIYEQPIINLGVILDKAPLPSFLRESAFSELALLANSLLTLFTGGVRLHATELTNVNAIFSGYFEHFDGQTKRVSVIQWLKEAYHPQAQRVIQPNCQILVREIMGRSSRGGAIGGSDLRVRCGLRFGSWISYDKWRVSIDSGIPASDGHQRPLLKSIGSITQAYNESRKYTDTINTFHFDDPDTKTAYPGESESQFSTFNRYLNLVFRELARI